MNLTRRIVRSLWNSPGSRNESAGRARRPKLGLERLETRETPASVPIDFTVSRDGPVSLVVYNSDGVLVRTLLAGAQHSAGSHTEVWDGRDRYGNALPAGNYEWRLLEGGTLTAEYVTAVGATTGSASEYPAGNHNPPLSAVSYGTTLYLAAGETEGRARMVRAVNLATGDETWGATHWLPERPGGGLDQPLGFASTILGNAVYTLSASGQIYGYNRTTGRVITGGEFPPNPIPVSFARPPGSPNYYGNGLDLDSDPRSAAAGGNLLVVSSRYDRSIRWIDPGTRQVVATAANVGDPVSVSVDSSGKVFFISGGAVYSVTRSGSGATAPVLVIPASQLQSPWRISVDRTTGDIFVAENSDPPVFNGDLPSLASPHHQVKRFSAAGALLRTFGRADGRQDGVFVPTDFLGIHDISADGAGGFVVTEPWGGARRVATFDANTGAVRYQSFGGQHWAAQATPEPGDPYNVWFAVNPGSLVRARLNPNATNFEDRWKVQEVYYNVLARNGLWEGAPALRITERNGLLYLHTSPAALAGSFDILVYDPAAKTVRPSNHIDWREGVFWSDRNDDGLVTPNEQVSGFNGGGFLDPATFNILTTPLLTGFYEGRIYAPTSFTPGGTPVYSSPASVGLAPRIQDPRYTGGSQNRPLPTGWSNDKALYADGRINASIGDFLRSPDGSLYGVAAGPWDDGYGQGIYEAFGNWYFNQQTGVNRVYKFDASGKLLWSVGRHADDADKGNGETANARGFAGFGPIGTVVVADSSDEEIAGPAVYSSDGLYVDEIFRATDGQALDLYWFRQGAELPIGSTAVDPTDGSLLLFLQSTGGGAPVYKVTGWGNWRRQSGTFTMATPAAPLAANGTGLKAEYFANATLSGFPVTTRTDNQVFFRWNTGSPAPGIPADGSGNRTGDFSVRWTGQIEAAYSGVTTFDLYGSLPYEPNHSPTSFRLWVDGRLIIDSGNHGPNTSDKSRGRGEIILTPGRKYDVRLEVTFPRAAYGGYSGVTLTWASDATERGHVPQRHLFPTGYTGGGPTDSQIPPPAATPTAPVLSVRFDAPGERGAVLSNLDTAAFTPGRTGNGVTVSEGTGIDIDNRLVELPDTNYAFSYWFRTTSADVTLSRSNRNTSYNNAYSGDVLELAGGRLRYNGNINGGTTALNDNQWHHVLVSVDPSRGTEVYVDGARVAVNASRTRRDRISDRLGFSFGYTWTQGINQSGGPFSIDDLKIYHRSLTQADVTSLIASTPANTAPRPAAPTLLTADQVGSGVVLTWSNVAGETGYRVERRVGNDGPWRQLGNVLGVDVIAYTDGTPLANVQYQYRVFAVNSSGFSVPSNVLVRQVTPTSPNQPPTASDVSATTAEDTAVVVTLPGTDPDGDPLTYALGTGPSKGTVTIAGNKATYTPAANFSGSDSFTFTASDGKLASAPATVSITVNPINDAPTALSRASRTAVGTPVVVTLAGSDPDGDPLSYSLSAAPRNGTVAVSGNRATYTPNAGFAGIDTFAYVASDGTLASAPATVTVTVSSGSVPNRPGRSAPQGLAVGSEQGSRAALLLPAEAPKFFDPFPDAGTGVRVVSADVTGDGIRDLIAAAGPGQQPTVAVYDGESGAELSRFLAFESSFTGGVYVAAGDLDGDGKAEVVVTPDRGGGPVVAAYLGSEVALGRATEAFRFFGIQDSAFRGGARSALGDVNGDGILDLVVSAGFLGGPRVTIWDGASVAGGRTGAADSPLANFFAFEETLRNGAYVAAGDANGDGTAELVFGGGPGGGPRVRVMDAAALLAEVRATGQIGGGGLGDFFAGPDADRNGARVAVVDMGDGPRVVAGSGSHSRVSAFAVGSGGATLDREWDPFGDVLGGVYVG